MKKSKLPMDNYHLLPKKQEQAAENEIRVKSQARPFVYAAYAGKLLFEKKHDKIYLLATGQATSKVIQAVEYIRKRVKDLHVAYQIECTEFIDEYAPKVEGLENVQLTRSVPTLKANLTIHKPELINKLPGYMAPLAHNLLLDEEKFKQEIEVHFSKDKTERGEQGFRERKPRNRNIRGYQGDRPQNQDDERGGRNNNYNRNRGGRVEGDREERRDRNQEGRPQRDQGENRPQRQRYDNDEDNRRPPRNNYRGQGEFRNDRGGRFEGQDGRVERQNREPREYREPREPREHREPREPREHREPREPRAPREYREPREHREYREPREPREHREPREPRDYREPREPREPRENRIQSDRPERPDRRNYEQRPPNGQRFNNRPTDAEGNRPRPPRNDDAPRN